MEASGGAPGSSTEPCRWPGGIMAMCACRNALLLRLAVPDSRLPSKPCATADIYHWVCPLQEWPCVTIT